MNKGRIIPTIVLIITIIGLGTCLFACFLCFFGKMEFSGCISIVSSIISIGLALISTLYSYSSGEKTSKLMKEVDDHTEELREYMKEVKKDYKAFVDKINLELNLENRNRDNIADTRNAGNIEKYKEKIKNAKNSN